MSLYKGNQLISGHQVLYSTTGTNTDGAMTQKATTNLTKLMNAQIMGSLTVSDYVVSGFSNVNYLVLPNLFNPGASTWEMVLKVKTASTWNSVSDQLVQRANLKLNGFLSTVSAGNIILYASSDGTNYDIASAVTSTLTVNTNTDYYFRYQFTGSAYKVDVSTDNSTWTNYISVTSSTAIHSFYVALGAYVSPSNTTQWWGGSIDLKESYIKIGDGIWWSGVDYVKDLDHFKNGDIFNKAVDGTWHKEYHVIQSGVASPTSSNISIDISSYLPNDGYNYEVLLIGNVTTGTASGNIGLLQVQSDISNTIYICAERTRYAANAIAYGNCVLPVGLGRTVIVVHYGNNTGTFNLIMQGYRRIGTNS